VLTILTPPPSEVFAVELYQIEGAEHDRVVAKSITESVEYREAASYTATWRRGRLVTGRWPPGARPPRSLATQIDPAERRNLRGTNHRVDFGPGDRGETNFSTASGLGRV
jgi:hypothetical protein